MTPAQETAHARVSPRENLGHAPGREHAATAQQVAHEEHFIKRARKRFGLRVSPARYREFMLKVTENQEGTMFLGHQPPNRTKWRIRAGGHCMKVIFDHITERLVTCMHCGERDAPDRNRRQKLRRLRREGKA